MKCLILAAGYATRLYPLTENFPKPLLQIADKTILDWLLDDIESSKTVDEYILISNHKYLPHFLKWAEEKPLKITVIDDGTTDNDHRLGAVLDIKFAIDKLNIDDDLLIIAGDNVLDFSLTDFISYALAKKASCIMRYFEPDYQRLIKCGVVVIDSDDKITAMTEKSPTPATHWCCPPFYYYTKSDIRLIDDGINSGCGTDAPGSFAAYLSTRVPVYAMEMPGHRFDVGTVAGYEKIRREYKGICLTPTLN